MHFSHAGDDITIMSATEPIGKHTCLHAQAASPATQLEQPEQQLQALVRLAEGKVDVGAEPGQRVQ